MRSMLIVFTISIVICIFMNACAYGDFNCDSNLPVYKIPYDTIELNPISKNADDPLKITTEFMSEDGNITVGVIHNQHAMLFDYQSVLADADTVGHSLNINGHVDHENSLCGHIAVVISENHTYVTSVAYPDAEEILTIYSYGGNHTSGQHASIVSQILRSLDQGKTKYI